MRLAAGQVAPEMLFGLKKDRFVVLRSRGRCLGKRGESGESRQGRTEERSSKDGKAGDLPRHPPEHLLDLSVFQRVTTEAKRFERNPHNMVKRSPARIECPASSRKGIVMKRTFGALVVAVLLSMTAQSETPGGDRPSGQVTKSYSQILAEIFGLKPAMAPSSKLPGRLPNMRCQTCDDPPPFQPSPSDCGSAQLPPGCNYVKYCRVIPSDPRCMAVPPS